MTAKRQWYSKTLWKIFQVSERYPMANKSKRKINKAIAYMDGTIAEEKDLPYPFVYYPGSYGAFLGFKKDKNSDINFCTCSYSAIENYIKFKEKSKDKYSYAHKNFILSSSDFPMELVESMTERKVNSDRTVIDKLTFKDRICHECNNIIPSYRYCHEMYGGLFRQTYGWYIKKQAYEYGVKFPFLNFLPDVCPDDVLALLKIKCPENGTGLADIAWAKSENDELLFKELQKQNRMVRNLIENEVRRKFGQKNIGESWISETILYSMVKELYPHEEILHHYRPKWLDGLELDIFIKQKNIGIEYQGQQHYMPIKHWGGEEGLSRLKERDLKKKKICKKIGLKLIYFTYKETISKELVKSKIEEF